MYFFVKMLVKIWNFVYKLLIIFRGVFMEEKKKSFWTEFKNFISKGNVIDLAVAVVIGAAFNKIVSSLVNDIIMPLISLCVGGANVTDWKWVIKPAEYDEVTNALITAETSLKYGVFIQAIIDFLIIAFTLFIIIKIATISSKKLSKMGEDVKKLTRKEKKVKDGEVTFETEATEKSVATKVEMQAQPVSETSEQKESVERYLKEIRDLLREQQSKKVSE